MRGRAACCVAVVVLAVAGCGRIGFAPSGDSVDASGSRDSGSGGGGDGGADGSSTTELTFPATADTALNSFASSLNYGGATSFSVRSDLTSTFVGLVRFDLSSVTGTLVSAKLRLTTTNQALSTGSVQIMGVLEAWEEGTQTGFTGTANYALRQGTVAWTVVGCGPGSRDGVAMAELQPFTMNTPYEVTLPVQRVQAWLDDPSSNHGLVLVPVGTGSGTVAFSSRESGTAPELVLEVAR